jgi:hypothetical protein
MIAAINRPALKPRSSAAALATHLWMRHRIGLSIMGTYLVMVSCAARWFGYNHRSIEAFMAVNILPLLLGFLYLIALFTNPEADLSSARSGYPSYMLTLPVRTRDLVFWPVLFGVITSGAAWLIAACLIFRPLGLAAPVIWPAALLALTCAWVQALFWTPLRVPGLRILAAGLLIPIVVVISVVAQESPGASWGITLASVILIPAAYLIALEGVARARRGDTPPQFSLAIPLRRGKAEGSFSLISQPFQSRLKAQIWADDVSHGRVLSLLVFGACLLASLPLLWVRDMTSLFGNAPIPGFANVANIEVNAAVKAALIFILITPGLAFCVGGGSQPVDGARKQSAMPPFLAVRPVLSGEIVLAKMLMAGKSTIRAWGVILGFLLIWLLVPARLDGTDAPLISILARAATAKTWIVLAAVFALSVFVTWRSQVQALFVNLTGRIRIAQAYFLFMMLVASSALISAFTYFSVPSIQQQHIASQVRILVTILLILKFAAIGPVIHTLIQKRLATPRALGLAGALWCLTAAILYFSLSKTLPADLVAPRTLFSLVVLFVPFVRLAIAPLSLDWNRHR